MSEFAEDAMTGFAAFWVAWPKKVARAAAEKAWRKNGCAQIQDKIVTAVHRQKRHWSEAKYIPHPASWLNAGRWDDELHVETAPHAKPAAYVREPWPQPCRWQAGLNRLMLDAIQQAKGVSDEALEALLEYKKSVGVDLAEAYAGDNPEASELAEIEANIRQTIREIVHGSVETKANRATPPAGGPRDPPRAEVSGDADLAERDAGVLW